MITRVVKLDKKDYTEEAWFRLSTMFGFFDKDDSAAITIVV